MKRGWKSHQLCKPNKWIAPNTSVSFFFYYSVHNALGFLSLFKPIIHGAIHVLTSKAFNVIIIIITILANSFQKGGVCKNGGDDDDGSEGVGGEHMDGRAMDQIYQRAEPQRIVLLPLTIFVIFHPTDHLPVLCAQRSWVPVSVPPGPSPGHQRAHLQRLHRRHHHHHHGQLVRHDEGGVRLLLRHGDSIHRNLHVGESD